MSGLDGSLEAAVVVVAVAEGRAWVQAPPIACGVLGTTRHALQVHVAARPIVKWPRSLLW